MLSFWNQTEGVSAHVQQEVCQVAVEGTSPQGTRREGVHIGAFCWMGLNVEVTTCTYVASTVPWPSLVARGSGK